MHAWLSDGTMCLQIRASDIDFWREGLKFDVMRLRHDKKLYPPRVKMTVSFQSSDLQFKLPVKFEGCSNDSQLDVELTFPLSMDSKSTIHSIKHRLLQALISSCSFRFIII